jgi:hypothetical protein
MSRIRVSVWLAHPLVALILVAMGVQIAFEVRTELSAAIGHIGLFLFLFLFLLATTAVGWLLAWKRPRNALGWLLLAVSALYLIEVPARFLGDVLHGVAPGAAAWACWAASDWTWVPPVTLLFTQIPLRFPDGRLRSPRWRWFSWFTIVSLVATWWAISTNGATVAHGIANPTFVHWTSAEQTVLTIVAVDALPVVSYLGSLASLFIRYRRADAVSRAQLRWVFWGAAVPIVMLTLFVLGITGFFPNIPDHVLSFFLVIYALIPISIGVAVMRYGLYGIALATLAAAAVFLPLLRVVQRLVDRRFNRAAYNAQKVVDAFGERLRAGADPHAAGADLVGAVEQTLEPFAVGIWTRTVSR